MPSFQILVLGFLFVSFRPSRFRSHSCSTGASLLLSLSGFPLSIHFLSSASLPVLTTQPSVSSFPLSSRFPPHSGSSSVLPLCLSASLLFHFRSTWFPMLSFRFCVLGCLSVSFHPSQFRSHSRSTGASLSLSPSGFSLSFLLSFVRFCSGSGYSAFSFFLSFSSRFRLTAAFPMPASALASSVSSFSPA